VHPKATTKEGQSRDQIRRTKQWLTFRIFVLQADAPRLDSNQDSGAVQAASNNSGTSVALRGQDPPGSRDSLGRSPDGLNGLDARDKARDEERK